MKYLIVGGVAGGMSAATRLRRLDEQAQSLWLKKGPMYRLPTVAYPIIWAAKLRNEAIC